MRSNLVVYVADAGSITKGNFHWVSSRDTGASSSDPEELAVAIADDLRQSISVALGYESPLFVPVDDDKALLGKSRIGECEEETGNRSFNAGAGAAVLATGLQSLAWVLRKIKVLSPNISATTRWTDFQQAAYPLFIWEAFVSGSEKSDPPCHRGDAVLAISAFQQVMNSKDNPTRVKCATALSLAGAAVIAAGLSSDIKLLSEPCVVLRPIFPPDEARNRYVAYQQRLACAREEHRLKKAATRTLAGHQ